MGSCLNACVRCFTYLHDRRLDLQWADQYEEYTRNDPSFLEAQLPVNHKTPTKLIHVAVIDKSIEDIRRILKDSEAAKTKLNSSEESAVHLACRLGYTHVVDVLIECGCPADLETDIGSPLHCVLVAIHKNYISTEGGVDLMLKIIHAGCRIDSIDKGGKTALFLAVELGNVLCSEILIEAGAAVSITESNGFSPLYIAVVGGNVECVRTILKSPLADTNIRDSAGRTALLAALITIATNFRNDFYYNSRWRGNTTSPPANRFHMTAVVELLLRAGADANVIDNHGRNALVLAFQILDLDMLNCSRNCGCFNKPESTESGKSLEKQSMKEEKESIYASLTRLLVLYGGQFPSTWTGNGKDYSHNPRWLKQLYLETLKQSMKNNYQMEKPNRLSHICRMVIRAKMADVGSLHLTTHLPLPTKLIDFVDVRYMGD